MESFFSSLKREKLYRCNCHSVGELYAAVSNYVAYYNTKRPHQTLGFLTPDAKEAAYEAGGSEVCPFSTILLADFDDMKIPSQPQKP